MRILIVEVAGRVPPVGRGPSGRPEGEEQFLTLPDFGYLCRLLGAARLQLLECLIQAGPQAGPLKLPELVQRIGLPSKQLLDELALLERHALVESTAQGWQVPYEEVRVQVVLARREPEQAG